MNKLIIVFLLLIAVSAGSKAQPVTVGGSDYLTLQDAFTDINDGNLTGDIVLEIVSSFTQGTAILQPSGYLGNSDYTSITIYPTGAGYTISGNVNGPLIVLNGADNVTIDGRVNQSGSADLTIYNSGTGTSASTILFTESATDNTIQFCNIKGSGTGTATGIISFSTSSLSSGNGNDGNTIDNNFITGNSGNRPINAIYSSGTAARENSENIISSNNFFDFLNKGTASNGINLDAYTTGWTINGNSFYETSTFVPEASVDFNAIYISNTTGTGFIISGNHIGGSDALCSGTAWTKTNAFNNGFGAITINAGTGAATSIQDNTIRNFSWVNSDAAEWAAINIIAGEVNIGTSTGNNIGDASTGSISVTGGANNTNVYGIKISTPGSINCQNNSIGSITASNSDAAFATNLYGIYKSAASGSLVISNNTIGSSSVANSMNANSNSSSNPQSIYGISNAGTGNTSISANLIANLRNGTTSSSGNAGGIYFSGGTGTNSVNGNFIHSITAGSGSATSSIYGINIAAGITSYFNNIISLGGNTETVIYGIYESGGASDNNSVYFNTVYIGGIPTLGANNTYAIYSNNNTNTRNIRNNIFNNVRSSGSTGKHYSAFFNATGGTLTCDYNDYHSPGTGGVIGYYGGDVTVLPVVTGQDANSKSVRPSFASPGGTSASDYLPAEGTLASGVSLSIVTDYNGVTRGAPPTMGAFEMGSCTNPTSGGTIAAAQSGCTPFDPAALTSSSLPSGFIGTIEYKWQQSTTDGSTGFTDISISNSTTYNPGSLSQTTWFKRLSRVDCETNWSVTGESNVIEITVNQLPVANAITGDNAVCMGDLLSLSSNATGTPTLTYTWSSTNIAVATVNNTGVVTPVSAGTTDITYTVTDGSSTLCQATSPVLTVTVNALPAANPITGGNALCMGGSLTLSPNATGTPVLTYTWNSENTFVATIDNSGVITPVSAGFANIRYTVTDGTTTACSATSAAYRVDVYPLPVAGAITGSNAVCAGGTTTLTSNATGTGTLTYAWNSSNTAVATVDNLGVVTALTAGTTDITYTVTDGTATACQATSPAFTVTVNALPVAGAITGGNAVCMGSSLTLTSNATGSPTLIYTWNSTNTSVATVSNSGAVTPVSPGTTDITYTVTDGSSTGCQATSPVHTVTVNALPAAGAITGSNAVCQGSTITLSPNATGTPTLTYSWSSSNTPAATVDNAGVVTGVAAGTSDITYTVTDGSGSSCQSTSPVFSVTVNDKPVAGSITGAASACPGESVSLVADATGTPVLTFTWSSSNTSVATVNNSGVVTTLTAGTTNITYTVTDGSSTTCSDTSPLFLFTVNDLPDANLVAGGTSTVCPGTGTNITVALSEAGVDYQLRNDSDNTNIGSPVSGTGGTISLPTGNLTSTKTFNILATKTTTGCSAELIETEVVTVAADAAGGSVSGVNSSIVYGASTGTLTLSGHTGNVSKWQRMAGTGSWEDISNTAITYSEAPSSAGTWQYRAHIIIGTCSEAYSSPFSITVDPKPLIITANDQTKVYGSAFSFSGTEFSAAGLINNDAVTGAALSSPGTQASAEVSDSPYVITPSAASGTGISNYSISYTNGAFSITKAPLTFTSDNKTREYNTPNPVLTFIISGFVSSETESVLDILPDIATTAIQSSATGTYPITISGGSDNNYTYNYIAGVLTVTRTQQDIIFTAIPEMLLVKDTYTMAATSTSGLPVLFESLDPGLATVSGDLLTGVSAGDAQIRAYHAGDQNFDPAETTVSIEIYSTHQNILYLFTPNYDGINDYWELPDLTTWGKCYVKVYSRWGQLVYSEKDYNNLWDGTSNGSPLPEGAYYFIIDTENVGVVKGTVNLVR